MTEAAGAPAALRIEAVSAKHLALWLPLRHALWPDTPRTEHASEAATLLRSPDMVAFVALTDDAVGFAEASIRRDFVNGCDSSPVAFLEGLYVDPAHRRRGIARALCAAVAHWGKAKGCRELASDTQLDNLDSQGLHKALGFAETERVVFFRKSLG
jgi:aminoglycoside 6'-N-acetyltransferase I